MHWNCDFSFSLVFVLLFKLYITPQISVNTCRMMAFRPVCCSWCRPWQLSVHQTHARTQSVAASCTGWSPPWSPCARSPSCSMRGEQVSWTWRTEWPIGGVSSAWPTLKGMEKTLMMYFFYLFVSSISMTWVYISVVPFFLDYLPPAESLTSL